MPVQHLPTYIHTFENDARWHSQSTEHYVFHFFQDSEAEKDMDRIMQTQEDAYKKIIEVLQVASPDRKIEYFFYPDPCTKKELMGDEWYAQSIYNEFRIHVLYTQTDKPIGPHEDTHLLSLPWGLSVGFFQEGLAEYMVEHAWDGTPHIDYVRRGYEKSIFPALSVFFAHQEWVTRSETETISFYSLAGAFATFLITTYGMEKFKEMYMRTHREKSSIGNRMIFEKLYGNTIEIIEEDFKCSIVL